MQRTFLLLNIQYENSKNDLPKRLQMTFNVLDDTKIDVLLAKKLFELTGYKAKSFNFVEIRKELKK